MKTCKKISKYFPFFLNSVKRDFFKPYSFIGTGFLLVICLIVFLQLWKVVDPEHTSAKDRINLVWYLAFNEWLVLSIPSIHNDIQIDIVQKYFFHRFLNPISYLVMKFSQATGHLIVNLFFLGIVSIIFTYLFVHQFIFNTFWMWIFFIFLTILSGICGLIFQIIIGLMGFWYDEVVPFYWIWEKMLFVFGGLLFPLNIYPTWLKIIAYSTPFSSMLAIRSSLIYEPSLNNFLDSFFSTISWIIFGMIFMKFLFYKAQKNLLKNGI